MRVTKLQAMRLEAIGKYEDADKLYEKLIEADETNPVCFYIKILNGLIFYF